MQAIKTVGLDIPHIADMGECTAHVRFRRRQSRHQLHCARLERTMPCRHARIKATIAYKELVDVQRTSRAAVQPAFRYRNAFRRLDTKGNQIRLNHGNAMSFGLTSTNSRSVMKRLAA
jgi:hypothetical protein